ncbi:phospholipase D-like domain-containing protein [Pelagicoccus mobilis]|uniref:Phospholipase D family protein n=1 Tax=Pelagicoccus mobilis TaxID=415221 RepID=A0A934VT45_9BACT|nr:phospholipase D family protein [Pelagicoccus mobilis]MBK1879139.1 phospholipase D family protein [Pelagicoccus mobilis]
MNPNIRYGRNLFLLLCLTLAAFLSGCVSFKANHPTLEPAPARADTRIALALQELTDAHPGESGYYLLPDGADSFLARIAAIELAEDSIEAQYFIFKNDLTGRLFLDRLLAAADRGVKVRLIVDDLAKTWKDRYLAAAVVHPNFELRLFNPATRIGSVRILHDLAKVAKMHRRMHNKQLVIDGKLAIIGGRNIANEYFGASDRNVVDLDSIVIGEIVPDFSRIFEDYWAYSLSVPVEKVALQKKLSQEKHDEFRAQLAEWNESEETQAYLDRIQQETLLPNLNQRAIPFYWGKAYVYADDPKKLDNIRYNEDTHLMPDLIPYAEEAEESMLLISPYFIPGRKGSEWLGAIAEKGVNVAVVTNSLDSNDHPLVHSAYMKYRKRLLKSGVQLLETNAIAGGKESDPRLRDFSAGSLLHTKLFIIDKHYVMIGSTNLDPRSRLLNTELMTVFESPKLAANIIDIWQLESDGKFWELKLGENEQIVWQENSDAPAEPVSIEPGTTWWERQKLRLLRLIPIEEQL